MRRGPPFPLQIPPWPLPQQYLGQFSQTDFNYSHEELNCQILLLLIQPHLKFKSNPNPFLIRCITFNEIVDKFLHLFHFQTACVFNQQAPGKGPADKNKNTLKIKQTPKFIHKLADYTPILSLFRCGKDNPFYFCELLHIQWVCWQIFEFV